MAVTKLNPPIIDGMIIAQAGTTLQIPFQMNRSVARGDVSAILAEIKSVQTNMPVAKLTSKGSDDNFMYYKNNQWWADFEIAKDKLQIGQYYKVQLAYQNKQGTGDEREGFWSTVATFKYTDATTPIILKLQDSGVINTNIYEYTGQYTNTKDPSEKVYSYWFNIYELGKDTPVITSGELLHNSSTDMSSTTSTDTWTTRWSSDGDYTIEYNIRTVNGLELSSTKYRITDNQTIDSDILQYYDFVSINNKDGGYVELAINPLEDTDHKYVNGQFILLRASSEDNFQSWYQLTEFILANWDSTTRRYLCRDYCVSQGVTYRYALQAFNAQGIYSKRIEAEPIFVDFEDMYLSDGERQLRVRFNPKVTSFKNTILESKMDTIGGQYPFFFRNGNVKYKEFPISGLISALSDENGEFMQGLQIVEPLRTWTEADAATSFADPLTSLSAENFRREREFKTEVLEWLTNGKPKLFRSPGEGSFLVRLMNTSLSPNDTLSRMLHTFSCTAYEIADCTFENLRAYDMLMEEKLETRDLAFSQYNLSSYSDGRWDGKAVMATITGQPNTRFYYRCQNDKGDPKLADLGVTGVYEFDRHLLAENPLVYLQSYNKTGSAWQNATVTYAYYVDAAVTDFSIIDRVEIVDKIEQWIGSNRDEIAAHLDAEKIRHSIGTIYYLKVATRPQHTVTNIEPIGGNKYKFLDGSNVYNPSPEVIVKYVNGNNIQYFDGRTSKKIDNLDYTFDMLNDDPGVAMDGQYFSTNTNGRIILTDLKNINYLWLGNAVYADVVYQFTTRYFTIEKADNSHIALLRKAWESDIEDNDKYQAYYSTLISALGDQKDKVSVNAI